MPKLEGIREFLQVVESGSFSNAADKLELSTAQVSRLVSRLEKHLGVRLLQRSTRRLSLTDEGELYYKNCKHLFESLEKTEREIGQKALEPSGTLKINLSGWFQEQYLVPMMIEFMEKYPKLKIEASFTDNQVDLIEDSYDLAIGGGELSDSSYIMKQIARLRFCICATPKYFERYGMPESLADLDRHNCLAGSGQCWQLNDAEKSIMYRVAGNWKSDNAHALLKAALHNAGLVHLPVTGIDKYLRTGRLVEVLHQHTSKGIPVWIMYPSRNLVSAKVRFFIDFLQEKLMAESLDRDTKQRFFGIR